MKLMNDIKNNKKKYIIICSIIICLAIFLRWQNNGLVVSNYTFSSAKITDELDGYKIVQISDLHNKEFGTNNAKLINKIKEENPDMIVITGDLIDYGHSELDIAIDAAQQMVDIAPVYYVSGNHELSSENIYLELLEGLSDAGIRILENEMVKINDSFYLVGISDRAIQFGTAKETAKTVLLDNAEDDSEDVLKVLLAHEPQLIEEYTDFDIVFSGHAHGGQVRIPFTDIGLVAPDQGLFPKYTSGEYRYEETTMYVSRGLGNSIIPFRIFNRPEILTVTFSKTKE